MRKGKKKENGSGFTGEDAVREAKRCLQCPAPKCETGCPAHRPIKEVNRLVAEGKFAEATGLVRGVNPFPGITSRVCAQERQCEGACVLAKAGKAIRIGKLEQFLADREAKKVERFREKRKIKKTNKNAAMIGSGPASLACAYELALNGFGVKVFEQKGTLGGMVGWAIPCFRLPEEVVGREIRCLKTLGVEFERNKKIKSVKKLLGENGFDYVFLGIGAGEDMKLGIKGEELKGAMGALEFLYLERNRRIAIMKGKEVFVIGGGNSAVDAARVAARKGAKVTVAYRRTEKEMPARAVEVRHAREEGVKFEFLLSPKEFLGKGKLEKIVFDEMKLGKPDESGRRSPECTGKTITRGAEMAIVACGQDSALGGINDAGIELGERGGVKVNQKFQTSAERVYAAGDVVSGPRTVIEAIRDGRKAGNAIAMEAGGKISQGAGRETAKAGETAVVQGAEK